MKFFILITYILLIVFISSNSLFGQSAGDYRSVDSGSWHDFYTWEYYWGNSWGFAPNIPNHTAGQITIRAGHLVTISSSLTIDETVIEEGATLTLNGGNLTINDGEGIDLLVSGTFNISSGFYGSGSTVINNLCNWISGTVFSELTINESGTLSIIGGTAKNIRGTLSNQGTINWINGDLQTYGGGQINNLEGGLFNIQCDMNINQHAISHSSGSFENYGTLQKISGHGGTSNILSGTFTNHGTVSVDNATLHVTSSTVDTGHTGTFNLVNDGVYHISSGTHRLADSVLFTGDGILSIHYGTLNILPTGDTSPGIIIPSGMLYHHLNGTLSGSGLFIIEGNMIWEEGTVSNTNFQISSTGILDFDGSSARTLSGVLSNNGTINWNDGNIGTYGGGQINNLEGGLFNIQCDMNISQHAIGFTSGSFENYGTLQKISGHGGTSNILSGTFTNHGTVSVDNATLHVTSSTVDTGHTGTFNLVNDGVYHISSGTHRLADSVLFTGDGILSIHYGTLNILPTGDTSPGIIIPSGMLYHHLNGTLSGSGLFIIEGNMIWEEGTVSNTNFQISSTGILDFDGSSARTLSGVLSNNGTINWNDGNIGTYGGGQINNLEGGLFNIQCDMNISQHAIGFTSGSFENYGTLQKISGHGGTSNILSGTFTNHGTVSVDNATLHVTSSTVDTGHTGTFNLVNDGVYHISSGTHRLVDNVLFTGNGDIQLTSGTLNALPADEPGTGVLFASETNFTMTGGTFSGSGAVTVNGNMTWSGGTITNANFNISSVSALEISGSATKNLSGGTINNHGTVLWSEGTILSYNNAFLNNLAGALFDIQGGTTYTGFLSSSGSGTFNNQGLIQFFPPEYVTATFDRGNILNDGEITVHNGTLNISSTGVVIGHTGTFTAQGNGVIEFADRTHYLTENVAFNGNGDIQLTSGTLNALPADEPGTGVLFASETNFTMTGGTFSGSGAVTVNGNMTWSGGTITNANFNISSVSALEISGSATKNLSGGTINNHGTVLWSEGTILSYNNAFLNNLAGALFDIQGGTTYTGFLSSSGSGTFNNQGLIQFFPPEYVTATFDRGNILNDGEITVHNGTLNISSTGVVIGHTGTFTAQGNGVIEFADRTHYLTENVAFNGNGDIQLTSGTLNALPADEPGTGVLFASETNFTMTGGTFSGSGAVTVNGNMTWSGGTITNANFNISSASALEISGSATKDLSGGTINNHGTVLWSEGTIRSYNNAVFNNLAGALFDIQGGTTYIGYLTSWGSGTFNNYGVLNKSAGQETTEFQHGTFNNEGLISVETGTLYVNLSNFGAYSANSLNYGSYYVQGILKILNANITSINAMVTLDGHGSHIHNHNNENALSGLAAIGSNGSLSLAGGRDFASSASVFTNSGILNCGEGVLQIVNQEFINNDYSTLLIGHTEGISHQNNSGNIQGPGFMTLLSGASYVYNGTEAQVTGNALPAVVRNFMLDNQAGVTLDSGLLITENISLENGNLITGNQTVTLGASTANTGTLSVADGKIVGNFRRWVSVEQANELLFPLGTLNHYRTANLSFTTAPESGGTITASFISSDPGTAGLPLNDEVIEIVSVLAEGYWTMSAANGLSGGLYDLDLTANGFEIIGDLTSLYLLKRENAGSNWMLDGSHFPATGSNQYPIIHRIGLSGFSDFGVGSSEGTAPVVVSPVVTIGIQVNTVTLSWEVVTGANSYYVYRSEDPYAEDWGVPVAHTGDMEYTEETDGSSGFYRITASTALPPVRFTDDLSESSERSYEGLKQTINRD